MSGQLTERSFRPNVEFGAASGLPDVARAGDRPVADGLGEADVEGGGRRPGAALGPGRRGAGGAEAAVHVAGRAAARALISADSGTRRGALWRVARSTAYPRTVVTKRGMRRLVEVSDVRVSRARTPTDRAEGKASLDRRCARPLSRGPSRTHGMGESRVEELTQPGEGRRDGGGEERRVVGEGRQDAVPAWWAA